MLDSDFGTPTTRLSGIPLSTAVIAFTMFTSSYVIAFGSVMEKSSNQSHDCIQDESPKPHFVHILSTVWQVASVHALDKLFHLLQNCQH